ncbi:unnamed protein product [Lactuca saligna]|uniref:Uncharacterized protein n=1 Tax=Lactuca saligna TaxID=75948 RepID=A0AA35ZV85_LACSI|nr:unnamed protein product [Lactuca saligna]
MEWVSYPSPKDDQVVPHTPETDDEEYDPWIPIPPSLLDVKDAKPFEEDEEPFEEEKEEEPFEDEELDKEFGGGPMDISSYPKSSSHDDPVEHAETQEEELTELESLLEEAIPILSLKKEASSPSHLGHPKSRTPPTNRFPKWKSRLGRRTLDFIRLENPPRHFCAIPFHRIPQIERSRC